MAQRQDIPDDEYARNSFGMRRMTQGQVWAITIVAVVAIIGLVLYAAM